jgi:hypothetical protein
MTFKKINSLLLITICYFLVACGPTHKYYLTPPSTPEGQSCITQCKTAKLQCEQQAEKKIVKCEREARYYCDGRTPCTNRPVCDLGSQNCKGDFFKCYRDCGGTIKRKQK